MAVYNDTFMDTAYNPLDLITGINTIATGDFLISNLILFSFFLVFVIVYGSSNRADLEDTLILASLFTTILSVLFWAANALNATTIVYPSVIFFIMVMFKLFAK